MTALRDRFSIFTNPTARKYRLPLIACAVLLLALFLLVIWLLILGRDLDARHRPLDFAERFDFASGDFSAYIAWSERRLRTARPAASDYVISGLLPFRLDAPQRCADTGALRNGIVLTHDLLDSPYTMRELGRYFQERCFLVFGLLLPGHGTQPGDLLDTGWQEWAAAEGFAARELAKEVDNLYLSGHGVGATLALLEAAGNAEVDGLMLFAPALDTRPVSWRAAFDWLAPGARWDEVVPPYSDFRYDSRPYHALRESNALVRGVWEALPARPFEVPVFTVASQEDATVSTAAILDYMAERVHPLSQTLLYSRQPLAQPPERVVVYPSHYPDEGLGGVSHRGLLLPMHDSEFGWYGSSRDCGHYYREDADAYTRCMAGERTVQGEVTPEQLAEGLLQRSAFNPYYNDMLRLLDNFIAPVAPIPQTQVF